MTDDRANITAHRALIDACPEAQVEFCWRGPGTLLIARSGIEKVVQSIRTAGFQVLGYEGFELDGDSIRPRLDLIVDLTWRRTLEDPEEAVRTWPPNVWIDVATQRQ